jgi:hypothetical protein
MIVFRKRRLLILVSSILFVLTFSANAQESYRIDPAVSSGKINRELFSFVNYQYLFGKGDGKAVEEFLQLNPQGSGARIETRITEAEPENDNDNPRIIDQNNFFPEKSIVYVPDSADFVEDVIELGMKPMLLLCYNAPWLAKDSRFTGAPRNVSEWVEFALGVISYFEGKSGTGSIQYVEIWNEPNIPTFWTGTKEEYFILFNRAAEAIHKKFPHIEVGGPVLSPGGETEQWMRDFIETCGNNSDFISFHSYAQQPRGIVETAARYQKWFVEKTGKPGPRVIITESDHRISPDLKIEYLLERQLRLMENQDIIKGFYHFSLPYYEEGALVFGLIDTDAAIVGHNYWPYWLLRDFTGDRITPEGGAGNETILRTAGTDRDKNSISFVAYNRDRKKSENMSLNFMLSGLNGSGGDDRIYTLFFLDPDGVALKKRAVVPGDRKEFHDTFLLPPRTACVAAVKNTSVQEDVWITSEISEKSVIVGTSVDYSITVHNLSREIIQGRLKPIGQPYDWEVTDHNSSKFDDLEPGDSYTYRAALRSESPTKLGGASIYGYLSYRKPRTRSIRTGSVPVSFEALAPLKFDILPLQLFGAPGRKYEIKVTARNTYKEDIDGQILLRLPAGWAEGSANDYRLAKAQEKKFSIPLEIPAGADEGVYNAKVGFSYQGTEFKEEFEIRVVDYDEKESVPIEISDFRNSDLFTTARDFNDVDNFGGPFSYPAKFFPSGTRVNYLGVDFLFPPTETGKENGVRVDNQRIPVQEGNYRALYFLSAATNGDKTVELTLLYEDGVQEKKEVTITDWCRDVKYGEVEIAKAPYRHYQAGVLRDALPRIMFQNIEVNPAKKLTAIVLPEEQDFWLIAATLTK